MSKSLRSRPNEKITMLVIHPHGYTNWQEEYKKLMEILMNKERAR